MVSGSQYFFLTVRVRSSNDLSLPRRSFSRAVQRTSSHCTSLHLVYCLVPRGLEHRQFGTFGSLRFRSYAWRRGFHTPAYFAADVSRCGKCFLPKISPSFLCLVLLVHLTHHPEAWPQRMTRVLFLPSSCVELACMAVGCVPVSRSLTSTELTSSGHPEDEVCVELPPEREKSGWFGLFLESMHGTRDGATNVAATFTDTFDERA